MKFVDITETKKKRSNRSLCWLIILSCLVLAAVIMSAIALANQLQENDKNEQNTLSGLPLKSGSHPKTVTNIAIPSSVGKTIMQKSTTGTEKVQSPSVTTTPSTPASTTNKVSVNERKDAIVECLPVSGSKTNTVTKTTCERVGCVWITPAESKAPSCIYNEEAGYGVIGDISSNGTRYTIRLIRKGMKTIFGQNVHENMTVEVEMYNENALRIYFTPDTKAYEVPEEALSIRKPPKSSNVQYQYNVSFVQHPYFGIQVIRRSTGAVVFNTTLPGLLFSEQFIQLSTKLPSDNVYGFGEHNHRRFRHDMNWKIWPIFTRDVAPIDEWNLYGAHPVYMNLENDGNANMVFLKNTNAMDILLQPNPYPAVTYRTIGGVLDFYIFLGPTPEMAVQQYTEAIGRPLMPPYWSLGFQLCKWGYENLSVVEDVVERTKVANIPQDVQWGDIDYMYEKFIFTYNRETFENLPDFVDKLHGDGQRYVIIVDPGVGNDKTKYEGAKNNSHGYDMYMDGIRNETFVKSANGSVLQGEVWPGLSVFPDFTNIKRTLPWWEHYIKFFHDVEGVKFDGLWIDMNEPANFVKGSTSNCSKNNWNYPPYVPHILEGDYDGGSLYAKTICMDSKQQWGKHYDVHSLYGHSMAIVTNTALQNLFPTKRPFVITRSSFAGTGKFAATWLGDNQSHWSNIPWSVIGILEHSLFGFSLVGADICGFWYEAKYEMCLRWMQLGAFYPFSRNHNAIGWKAQDPAAWNSTFVGIARHALLTRYKMLPYLYTLFHEAHIYGKTVARPLMFEYPKDQATWDIDRQFLLGPAFMVTPVMEKGKRSVSAYIPNERWYNYYDGKEIKDTGKTHTLEAPLDVINLHLRGGYILPTQEPDNTTMYSRKRPMGLLVCLDRSGNANGSLFWDDGESKDTFVNGNYLSLTFSARQGEKLNINVAHDNYTDSRSLSFGFIEIYGLSNLPGELYIDNVKKENRHIRYKEKIVQFIDLNLKVTENHTLRWKIF